MKVSMLQSRGPEEQKGCFPPPPQGTSRASSQSTSSLLFILLSSQLVALASSCLHLPPRSADSRPPPSCPHVVSSPMVCTGTKVWGKSTRPADEADGPLNMTELSLLHMPCFDMFFLQSSLFLSFFLFESTNSFEVLLFSQKRTQRDSLHAEAPV